MKVIISGASGFVGSFLVPFLKKKDFKVFRLVRHSPRSSSEIFWNPLMREIVTSQLEGADYFINLSGENVANGRWTKEKKKKIHDSRIQSASLLVEAIQHLKSPPKAVLSASATGYYGDRGAEILHEESEPGKGFLSELAVAWEGAFQPLVAQRLRVVYLRFGMVLAKEGGALTKMLPIFKMGGGAILGSGRQYVSWIHIDDLCEAVYHAMMHEAILRGPLNVVAPEVLTQKEFAKTLGRILHRPVFLRAPSFALKLMMGEMAGPLILSSQRAEPARLMATGYQFQYPELEKALTNLLVPPQNRRNRDDATRVPRRRRRGPS